MRTLPARVWHTTSSIARMLRNTAYIGTIYEGKMRNLPGKRNPDRKTRHQHVPREQWIPITVPPIIDQATFDAAEAQLTRNKLQTQRNRKHDHLCVNGRLRCGQCGGAMTGATKPGGSRHYGCNRRPFQDAVAPHRRRTVQATAIEPVVWEAVERVLNKPALIAAELERRRERTSAQQADLDHERHHYTRQIAQCEKDLTRWEAAYLVEAIDVADFKAKKAEVDARRTSAERELTRLDDQQRLIERADLETASLMEYCARVWSELQHFTLDEKRRALEALDLTVIWYPDKPPEMYGSIPVEIISNAPR